MKPETQKLPWTDPQVKKFDTADATEKKPVTLTGSQCGQSVIRYGPSCGIRSGGNCAVRTGPACEPTRFGPSCKDRLGAPCGAAIPDEPAPPF